MGEYWELALAGAAARNLTRAVAAVLLGGVERAVGVRGERVERAPSSG